MGEGSWLQLPGTDWEVITALSTILKYDVHRKRYNLSQDLWLYYFASGGKHEACECSLRTFPIEIKALINPWIVGWSIELWTTGTSWLHGT